MNPAITQLQSGSVLAQKVETPANDIDTLHGRIDTLISAQSAYRQVLLKDRQVRLNDPDVEGMRKANEIGQADTVIGPKLIAQNIKMSKVPKLQYIVSPARVAMFTPVQSPVSSEVLYALEQSFTHGMRYPGWVTAYERADDASEIHGYGIFEVLYDVSKPLRVALNYVENDFLVFDRSVRNIQDCDVVLRAYELTLPTFEKWLNSQPQERRNEAGIAALRARISENARNDASNQLSMIYRLYLKQDGKIKTCWYWPEGSQNDRFLTLFVPFSNGIMSISPEMSEGLQIAGQPQPIPQAEFPFFLLYLDCTSETKIQSQRGRAVYDLPLQASAGSLLTSLINGCQDASKTMWSPKGSDEPYNFTTPTTIQMVIKPNQIWGTEMSPWHSAYPDALLYKVYEGLMSQGMQQANQVNWTVNNRQDTRKTGTEIKASERMQAQINTSSVLQVSKVLRDVYPYVWKIMQSQILYAGMKFWLPNLIQNLHPDMLSLAITNVYTIAPAGEKDYLEKLETVQIMSEDMELVLKTGDPDLILAFVSDYMALRLPDKAPKYIAIMQQYVAKKKQQEAQALQLQQMQVQQQMQQAAQPAQQMPLQGV